MIRIIIALFILSLVGCKSDQKSNNTAESVNQFLNKEDFSKNIFKAFTNPDANPVTIPWIEVEVPLNGARLHNDKMLPSGKYTYLEDEGNLYIDFTKATSISKVAAAKNIDHFVVPMQMISNEPANPLNTLGYFQYNQSTQSITQIGGVRLPNHISDIELEDMISAVQIRYNNKEGKNLSSRYLLDKNHITSDYSQWISSILAKDYLILETINWSSGEKTKNKNSTRPEGATNTFIHKGYDLNADGMNEAIVFITASDYCGSGGCNLIVFGSDQKLITEMTVTKTPIQVMQSGTEGYNDLSVYSDGAQRLLKFDGKSYPTNPSMASELSKDAVVEKVLIEL